MHLFRLLRSGYFILLIGFFCGKANAVTQCYTKMSEVLGCFLSYNDGVYKYKFVEENNEQSGITKRTYILDSQKWPVNTYADIPTTIWQHRLVFYLPKEISYSKVLLYVNGGRNRNIKGDKEWLSSLEQIDYASIALANKAPVVELQTVPNQYLFFHGEPFKEDQILAYTYKRFMDDPFNNAYLLGHLPMAKSVIKAMDAIQEILKEERNIAVTGFVLSGASKRGWAVWLAAISDNRVEAIVPIVINILNIKKSIPHICQSYGGICPPALRDYEKYSIPRMINHKAFAKLVEVEDPYSYLRSDYDAKYRKRFTIPKYVINASGDDFFVPDSSKWYFKNLPGENNYIRYLPNAMHYFKGNPISDALGNLRFINEALSSYFYFVLNKVSLPKVKWTFAKDSVEVVSSVKPKAIKLWVANNETTRDFRCLSSYSKLHLLTKRVFHCFSRRMCDNCYGEKEIPVPSNCKENTICKFNVSLPAFKKGWQASFVELHYIISGLNFFITTEINISPNVLPDAVPVAQLTSNIIK